MGEAPGVSRGAEGRSLPSGDSENSRGVRGRGKSIDDGRSAGNERSSGAGGRQDRRGGAGDDGAAADRLGRGAGLVGLIVEEHEIAPQRPEHGFGLSLQAAQPAVAAAEGGE